MLRDLPAALDAIADERDALEAGFIALIDEALEAGPETLNRAVAECWREAEAVEARWAAAFVRGGSAGRSSHARSWARLNHVAGVPRS